MVQYRPPAARAGRFSQRAQWGLHLGIEKNYNAWKIFDVHSKETVAARDVIFYERLTLQTYLANLQEDQDPTGGFRGNRAFASAEDEADWDEQNVDNASEEAGPLPFCSVDVPMDDDNPRESVNAETFYHFADNGYVTPATVNTNEAERVGPNFLPDPEAGDEAAYPEDANLPRYSQTGLQILGLVTAVHGDTLLKEPATVQQALGGEHREKWREAMDKELKALEDRNTWKVVPISVARNKTILTGKWVFRTFAPVSRHTSFRIILAIAAMKKKKLRQIDVANAFLYAPVDAEIFVELPHSSHGEPNQVCQLLKSLYGIKQAPRLWQQHLHARLIRIGFKQLPHDQGMYRLTKNEDYIMLIVYVDDLLYIGSTDSISTWFEAELQQDLTLTVSSTVTQYLGLNIREEENAIYLSAEKYTDTIAKRFTITPAAIFTPYRYTAGNDKGGSALLKPAGIRDYQKKLGCLLFAAVTCRPDLSYSASQLATYLKRPEAEHLAELVRALHYFVSTPTVSLTYHKNATAPPKLIGYCHAALQLLALPALARCPTVTRAPAAREQPLARTPLLLASSPCPERPCCPRAAPALRAPSAREQLLPQRAPSAGLRLQGLRPTALRVAPCCSLRVALCCSARHALLQPARRALLPCASRPAAARASPSGFGSPGGGGFGFMWPQRPRDCASQRCVPGRVEAAALGSSESAVAPGVGESAAALGARESADALGANASTATCPTSIEALHNFTLDSGTSRCFFRDCTTVTPLAAPAPVSLADPTGGPVVSRASTVFPYPAFPSGSLSGLHLPAFSTNLLSNAVLQNEWVDTFIPGGQRVAICTCSRTGRHLATFTCQPGSGLYTLTTASAQVAESGQVAASSRVSASGQLAASFSCRVLSHQTLLWHHRLGHPSLPRLHTMHSRLLVFGLPRSLPSLLRSPAPPCLSCVEGRQRAAPHSSEFPPTTAPLQTLHMDVWGPAPVGGTDQERYFLLVVDNYTHYTTIFPLRRKADVSGVLIPWIRATRRQLRERFRRDFPVLCLHSDKGGEFSSDLLADFCRDEGNCQSFTLPASPQQNGIAERRIGLIMEVARTSMIHAAAPHFLRPFAVRYATHQLNLWPCVSEPGTSPTLRWTGKVGDASVFRVWGALSLVRDAKASKLSSRTLHCVFLGFPTDAPP
ncbi:unnamed protein product [Closterium sp. NIES-53]